MNNKPPMPDNWHAEPKPCEGWLDCSMAELAYLALNGTYGQRLIANRYLETIAKDKPTEPVKLAFPKGRWTV